MSHEKGTWYANNFSLLGIRMRICSRYLVARPFKWWCCFLTLQVLIGTHIPMIGLFFLITTTHLSEAIDLFEDIIAFKEDLINGNQYHKYVSVDSIKSHIQYLLVVLCFCLYVFVHSRNCIIIIMYVFHIKMK